MKLEAWEQEPDEQSAENGLLKKEQKLKEEKHEKQISKNKSKFATELRKLN